MDALVRICAAVWSELDGRVLALLLARVLPIVALTPLFGGQAAPRRFRAAAAIGVALFAWPFAGDAWRVAAGRELAAPLAVQAFAGVCVAVVVNALFELFGALGSLVDLGRGATIANVLDPLTTERTSPLGPALKLLLLALAAASGMHREFLRALLDGVRTLPPGDLGWCAEPTSVLAIVEALFEHAVALALPVLACVLLFDVALGLVNRAARNVEVFFLALSTRALLGLAVFLACLASASASWLERTRAIVDGWLTLR